MGKSNGGVSAIRGEKKYLEPGSKIHFCHCEEGVLPDEAISHKGRKHLILCEIASWRTRRLRLGATRNDGAIGMFEMNCSCPVIGTFAAQTAPRGCVRQFVFLS